MAPSRAVYAWSSKCNILGATDHGELLTLVAGMRRSLLMAGNDKEVYDKKPQRYAEDKGTVF